MDDGIVLQGTKRSSVYAKRETPRMPDITVGHRAMICYNPDRPEMAYMKENVGLMNG